MLRSTLLAAAIAASLLGPAAPAAAQTAVPTSDPALFAFGLGIFDVLQDDGYTSVNANLEWRGEAFWWKLRPLIGIGANTDGAVYGYAGLALDLHLTDRLVLTPSFAPSLYFEGDSKDLGHVVEFRSGIELSYRFDDASRLGIALHHLSNASLDDDNPGTETLNLYYMTPLQYFLGH